MTGYFNKANEKGYATTELTSGTTPSNGYWKGRNVELVIASWNSGGLVRPPCATTCCKTDPAPADHVY